MMAWKYPPRPTVNQVQLKQCSNPPKCNQYNGRNGNGYQPCEARKCLRCLAKI